MRLQSSLSYSTPTRKKSILNKYIPLHSSMVIIINNIIVIIVVEFFNAAMLGHEPWYVVYHRMHVWRDAFFLVSLKLSFKEVE